MNEKIERVRYLNLKQHIDGLHLAKLIDDAEALHILTRFRKQFEPSVYQEDDMLPKSTYQKNMPKK